MAGGDSLVAHPRGCRPRSGRCSPETRPASLQCIALRPGIALIDAAPGRPDGSPAARHTGAVATRPLSGIDPRRARFLPVRRRGRPGPLRRQGQVAAVPGQLLLPGPGQPGAPDGPDGRRRRPRRVDGGRHRGRGPAPRAQPHPAVPAPVQRPAEGRQELSVAGPDRGRRVAEAGRGAGPQAQRACATSGPTRTWGPSGARSTCCSGRFRCGPARTPSSATTSAWGGRACCSTSSGARDRAWGP